MTLSDPRDGVLTPTDPRTAANKGVMTYDLGVYVRGVLVGHRRRQYETAEHNLIEFHALLNLKPQ